MMNLKERHRLERIKSWSDLDPQNLEIDENTPPYALTYEDRMLPEGELRKLLKQRNTIRWESAVVRKARQLHLTPRELAEKEEFGPHES